MWDCAAQFAADLLINPPERVELYTNRIVVRLAREGKFLIPLKYVEDVQAVDNPFKTFCQPVLMHTRATQMTSSVYIRSKSKGTFFSTISRRLCHMLRRGYICARRGAVSPMGMVLTVEDSDAFVEELKELLSSSDVPNPAARTDNDYEET